MILQILSIITIANNGESPIRESLFQIVPRINHTIYTFLHKVQSANIDDFFLFEYIREIKMPFIYPPPLNLFLQIFYSIDYKWFLEKTLSFSLSH